MERETPPPAVERHYEDIPLGEQRGLNLSISAIVLLVAVIFLIVVAVLIF